LLAQFADSGSNAVATTFGLIGLAWAIFVVYWMASLKTEVQRIRETVEHGVYDILADFGGNEAENEGD
jgi:uncharacterized membrane protein YgaE (UPF0421/DUF939 family)